MTELERGGEKRLGPAIGADQVHMVGLCLDRQVYIETSYSGQIRAHVLTQAGW